MLIYIYILYLIKMLQPKITAQSVRKAVAKPCAKRAQSFAQIVGGAPCPRGLRKAVRKAVRKSVRKAVRKAGSAVHHIQHLRKAAQRLRKACAKVKASQGTITGCAGWRRWPE